MIFRLLGVFALVLVPIIVYLFFYIRRSVSFFAKKFNLIPTTKKGKVIYNLVFVGITLVILYMCVNVFSVKSMIILHVLLSALAIEVINLLVKLIVRIKYNKESEKETASNRTKNDNYTDELGDILNPENEPTVKERKNDSYTNELGDILNPENELTVKESKNDSSKNKKSRAILIWNGIYRSGILPIFMMIAILIYGFVNISNVVETKYTIYTDKSIREEGYKVALISDLHFGNSIDIEELKKVVNRIEENQPDMLLLCGDIFDESSTYEGIMGVTKLFGNAKTTYGTYYVFGNHDRATYRKNTDFSAKQLNDALLSNNIKILSDDSVKITDDLILIGREDAKFTGILGGENGRKPIDELVKDLDKQAFLLLMDHQPVELEANVENKIDLQLSGHTHAGQIWPVGLISEILKFNELNYGYKKIDDFQVIVSSGANGWGYPIRTSGHSEYVIIDILPEEKNPVNISGGPISYKDKSLRRIV